MAKYELKLANRVQIMKYTILEAMGNHKESDFIKSTLQRGRSATGENLYSREAGENELSGTRQQLRTF